MENAIHIDVYAKEDFANYQALAMLTLSCNRDRRKMERIGNKVGIELPLTMRGFLNALQAVDRETMLNHYIHGYAIKKTHNPSKGDFYYVKFSFAEVNGKAEIASAIYYQAAHAHEDFLTPNETSISLEDFYNRVDKQFYLITLKNE